MRGFRFRLETVLRVRRHVLERARVDAAQARIRADAAARTARERADDARRDAERLRDLLVEGIATPWLPVLQADALRAVRSARNAEQVHAGAEQSVTACGQRAIEAHARVRALERLRERALAAHRLDVGRREQRELEELARLRSAAHAGADR